MFNSLFDKAAQLPAQAMSCITGMVTLPQTPVQFYDLMKEKVIDSTEKAGKIILAKLEQIQPEPTMKQLHLVTAVLARVSHFHALGLDFSAYDITTSLREKVKDGEYDITDVAKDTFAGAYVSVVDHSAVRDVLKELFTLDLIPNYTSTNHFNANANRGAGASYVLYQFSKNPNPTASNVLSGATSVPTTPATTTVPVAQTVSATLRLPDDTMWQKAKDYLANKRAFGIPATLKQVQSRLKGYSVTCEELRFGLVNRSYSLAYAPNLSESTVL